MVKRRLSQKSLPMPNLAATAVMACKDLGNGCPIETISYLEVETGFPG